MSIIFTGDCHFKDYILSKRPEIQGDSQLAVDELKAICLTDLQETGETALIMAGDVWDVKYPAPHLVHMIQTLIAELREAGIETYFIEGNHDAGKFYQWGSIINAIHLSGKSYTICGHVVYALDNMRRGDLIPALQAIPGDTEILVLHQALKDALSFVSSTGEAAYNLEKEDVPGFVRLVLLSDIHISEVYQNDTTLFAYPGSLTMQKMNEAPNKYVIRVNADCSIEYLPVQTREIHQRVVTTSEEMLALYNEFKGKREEKVLKEILDITYSSSIENAVTLIEKLSEAGHIYVEAAPVYSSVDAQSTYTVDSVVGINMEDSLPTHIDYTTDKEFYDFMDGYLRAQDKKGFLEKTKQSLLSTN